MSCAECHTQVTHSVVHEYEMSRHAARGISCLDCHQPANAQAKQDHHGFTIATKLTAGNCRSCHEPIYQEFLRSRHAAPSWAAVYSETGLKPEQVTRMPFNTARSGMGVRPAYRPLRARRLGSNSSIRFHSASSSNGLVMPGRLRVGDTDSTKPRIKVQEAAG